MCPSPWTCMHGYVSAHTHTHAHKLFLSDQSSKKVPSWLCYIWKGRFWSWITSQAVECDCHCCWLCAVLLTAQLLINFPSMGIIVLVGWNVGRVCVWPGIASLQCGSKSSASLGEACVAVPRFACTHTDPWGCLRSLELYTDFTIQLINCGGH